MKDDSVFWSAQYDNGVIQIIELFRNKYIPYTIYDTILSKYINQHLLENDNSKIRICSLGCGTGSHEINLSSMGYCVVGIDSHKESIEVANSKIGKLNSNIQFILGDFMKFEALSDSNVFDNKFDVILMLGVQLSTNDHHATALRAAPYLKQGGLFITGLFGYDNDFNFRDESEESAIEIAKDDKSGDFAVRLSTYLYRCQKGIYFIEWDSVYIYPGSNGIARLYHCPTYRLEVNPEQIASDPLTLCNSEYELLPTRKLDECGKTMFFPHTYEYLIGGKKR